MIEDRILFICHKNSYLRKFYGDYIASRKAHSEIVNQLSKGFPQLFVYLQKAEVSESLKIFKLD